ncbi:TolB family protein [Aridibaculum aurantiacum]|uniref:TolB family protein n=1 Tax=Aridibaculum aurantiacum TaxID=2810307 RepID=UPI001A961D61|nr:hypothetical protein [Aridibaculum aurantiacum]
MQVKDHLPASFFVSFKPILRCSFYSLLFIICLLVVSHTHAQVFGGNPSSIKWKQVSTDTARVIYPEGLDDAARRVASVVHEVHKQQSATIGNRLRKINIVLQNQSTVSNAYVGLGPYRSEFYLTPPQNSFQLGGLSWLDNLSVHEYRHVQQYTNFNVGLARAMSFVFGQQGQDLLNSAAVPDYFFEGDAVFSETVLSRQGRGRIPYFFNGFQSLNRDGRKYSFMKLRNGSLKDFVPDHYSLGYMLVSYGREKYGQDFWLKVSQDAVRFKPIIYPWQGAIRRHAGIPYKQFVNDAFNFYQQKWQLAKGVEPTYVTPKNVATRVDYKYPYMTEDGSLIVMKRGYRQIPAFYKVKENGEEEKLATRDIAHDDYFSYKNGRIVYASLNPDSRWGYREYSNIILMDAATGDRKVITNHQRYFAPDISNDGSKIVAVDMRTDLTSTLVVVDETGNNTFRSVARRGVVYTYPKFSANDSAIYTLARNEDGKMALIRFDIPSAKETELVPYANRVYAFPTVQGDTIFFSSTYKGSDEVWAFVENTKALFRVAVQPTGHYQAVMNRGKNLLFSSTFSSTGYKLITTAASDLLWQRVGEGENALPDLYVPNALKQEPSSTLENISLRPFTTQRYRKGFGFFNFHSWRPLYDLQEFSFTLYGQNVLNTFQSELAYTYNRNETSHRAGFTGIYGGWYLQPTLGINHTWDRTIVYNRDTSFNYNELNLNAGVRLPLNLSGGRQYRFLTLNSSLNNQQIQWTGIGKSLLAARNFNYIQGRLLYTGQIQQALQHIYPRWAQTLLLQYRKSIDKLEANQLLANAALYLPGLHVNHNLVINAAFQQRDTMNQYFFGNSFPFSRGYTSVDFPQMWRIGFNYHFPLFYPDFGIGNIVYFQRVRANGFYDITQGKSLRTGAMFPFNTAGGEMYFDTKWWNQQPVTFGIRYSRLLNNQYRGFTQPNQWELILPINLLD